MASLKRKAQQLVLKKDYAEAVEEYGKLAEMGEMDPYDYVVYGDLLLRIGEQLSAVERYVEALNSYAESGLNRSAIALAKKITRIAPQKVVIHQRLGDLYANEGLSNEACTHYMHFLENVDPSGEDAEQQVEDVSVRILGLQLPSFALVDRIVAAAQKVGRADVLAGAVFHQATQAGAVGDTPSEERLTRLAMDLNPDVDAATDMAAPPSIGSAPAAQDDTFIDPGAVHFDAPSEAAPAAASDALAFSLDDEDPVDFGSVQLDATPEPETNGIPEEVPAGTPPSLELDPEIADEASAAPAELVIDEIEDPNAILAEMEAQAEAQTEPEPEAIEPEAAPVLEAPADPVSTLDIAAPGSSDDVDMPDADADLDEDPDDLLQRALEFVSKGEPTRAQREYMRAARAYFKRGRSREAEDLYERVVKMDPNHLDALRGLVEIAHINGEKGKMANWGCELGDVLLARAMYGEAKLQFERVLAFDAGNAKATARVARLKNMDGVEDVNFGDLRPVRSEVQGAQIDVRDDKNARTEEETQSLFDLTQILDEFHSAVAEQIPAEDSQSHYDLGMAYKEMGLWKEAAYEFEVARDSQEHRIGALEMLAECYLQTERNEDAIGVLDELLQSADHDTEARLYVAQGRAYEALAKWDEAETAYELALELDGELTEAMERLSTLGDRRERGAA